MDRTYPRTAALVMIVFACIWPAVEIVLLTAEMAPVSFANWYARAALSWHKGLEPPEISWPEIRSIASRQFYLWLVPAGLVFGLLPALSVRRRGFFARSLVVAASLVTLLTTLALCALVEGARSGGEGLGPSALASAGLLWLSYVLSGLSCRWLLVQIGVPETAPRRYL